MKANLDPEERALRPKRLSEFIGERPFIRNLHIFIEAARQRKEPLDHTLFYGPPGLGKTTLAHIIAQEMGVRLFTTSGPALQRPADLAGLLTQLETGDVLFIDEIHRLHPSIEEYLYSAMEDYRLDIVIDSGPHAKTLQLRLKPFTLVGATTRLGLLTPPLVARFGITIHVEYYSKSELTQIVLRSAQLLGIQIEERAAEAIAQRSRGTPRTANRLLRRLRDFAQVKNNPYIDETFAEEALTALHIDPAGLEEIDKKYILTLIDRFGGGPTGLQTLAVAIGEEAETMEEVYEPYLIMEGFIERTPRGRRALPRSYEHFGRSPVGKFPSLFG
ncbi:MAG: Holliday junction branch migration DNA helicase RuvB [Bacteroidia bacterium]|nr:Holliday junction branch migration DNA helicase RuvB [Bacteroidia bacterium]MCX7763720.1 Holliday junction branch migration DNA helicase RuvB [Bacteroidia bacterium]MDW8057604.1 Holliday junction branch migration DNA helicase RuvB [Bacteroidia bacterium]